MAIRAIVARFLHVESSSNGAQNGTKPLALGWTQKSLGKCQRTPRSGGVDTPRVTVPLTTSFGTVGQRDTVTGQRRAQRARREWRGLPAVPGTTGRISCERWRVLTVSAGALKKQAEQGNGPKLVLRASQNSVCGERTGRGTTVVALVIVVATTDSMW